ncbi:hypothetical protein M885DRAFT_1854 [Pelagophyceae sp. CCMP2097]|nr:hypothetical protein M885DRAFT_1854 [Pelagophyceae sp. CCMP2097]
MPFGVQSRPPRLWPALHASFGPLWPRRAAGSECIVRLQGLAPLLLGGLLGPLTAYFRLGAEAERSRSIGLFGFTAVQDFEGAHRSSRVSSDDPETPPRIPQTTVTGRMARAILPRFAGHSQRQRPLEAAPSKRARVFKALARRLCQTRERHSEERPNRAAQGQHAQKTCETLALKTRFLNGCLNAFLKRFLQRRHHRAQMRPGVISAIPQHASANPAEWGMHSFEKRLELTRRLATAALLSDHAIDRPKGRRV